MKHLKRFNESQVDIKQDIMDNFAFINDKLGDPEISSSDWGGSKKYIFKWGLGINITLLNEVSNTIDKLKFIFDELDDILSAKDRLPYFDFMMSITDKLTISLSPKETGLSEFEFIVRQDWRVIEIKISEVERFFASKGIKVIKWKNVEEGDDSTWIKIILDKPDRDVCQEFMDLFDLEITKKQDSGDIDRDVEVNYGNINVSISPSSEKTYCLGL